MFSELKVQLRNESYFVEVSEVCSDEQTFAQLGTGLTLSSILAAACNSVCRTSAFLADAANIPLVTYGCHSTTLSAANFHGVTRVTGSFTVMTRFIRSIFLNFKWTTGICIVSMINSLIWMEMADELVVSICVTFYFGCVLICSW